MDILEDVIFRALPDASGSTIQAALQNRLDFAHRHGNVPVGGIIGLESSGVDEIVKQCEGGIGRALYLLHEAIPSAPDFILSRESPYLITGERIRALCRAELDYEIWHDLLQNEVGVNVDDIELNREKVALLSPAEQKVLRQVESVMNIFRKVIAYQYPTSEA